MVDRNSGSASRPRAPWPFRPAARATVPRSVLDPDSVRALARMAARVAAGGPAAAPPRVAAIVEAVCRELPPVGPGGGPGPAGARPRREASRLAREAHSR